MRRSMGLLLPALLAVALLVAPAAALADTAGPAADEPIVLAAEAGENGEVPGPPPMEREAEENPARDLAGYGDIETPFTWGAAFLMLFLGLGGVLTLGGLYWLLVHRPRQRSAQQ